MGNAKKAPMYLMALISKFTIKVKLCMLDNSKMESLMAREL